MSTNRFKNVKEMREYIKNNMDKMLESLKKNNEYQKNIGEELVSDVKSNMEKGVQVKATGGVGKKYDNLQDSTIKRRKWMEKQGKLSPLTSPSKAQNIMTGDLHKSLEWKANDSTGVISVSPDNNKDKDKAGYLVDMGREFLFASKKVVRKLKDITRRFISDMLK